MLHGKFINKKKKHLRGPFLRVFYDNSYFRCNIRIGEIIAGFRSPTVHELLGIVSPPPRPLSPYYRYLLEIRPIVIAQNPELGPRELIKSIANLWNNVDLKKREKYENAFRSEQVIYRI